MADSGFEKKDRAFIVKIVRRYLPTAKIFFFGSRLRGDHKATSDLDLCLDIGKPIPLEQFSRLKEELLESNLLFKVDLTDWHRITTEFQEVILRQFNSW